MTEDKAKQWIVDHFGLAKIAILQRLVDGVLAESGNQNLVAQSTLEFMWTRHIVDSAQLLALSQRSSAEMRWLDIGSGAGFPGLVVAALTDMDVILVEPRKKRAAFLDAMVRDMGLSLRVRTYCSRVQALDVQADVISARAVANLSDVFLWASGCASPDTQWILPKGKQAREEVEYAAQTWHGVFHVEHSITDPESLIVLAAGVTRR